MSGRLHSNRKKSRQGSFYGSEKPVFSNTKECIINSNAQLPSCSITYLLEKGLRPIIHNTGQSEDKDGIYDFELIEHQHICSNRFNIGISQSIGVRNRMEDTVSVHGNIHNNVDYIGVFDGHNGSAAAQYCMNTIPTTLPEIQPTEYEQQLNSYFTKVHANVCKETESGTTATICLIRENDVVIASCGDSPVFFIEGTTIKKVTKDHNIPNERDKIVANGGAITLVEGIERINGEILISRSIGDRLLHPPLVETPDIDVFPLSMDYIIMASDGITDSLSEEDILNTVLKPVSVSESAATLRNEAFIKKSRDNLSVVVIRLK
ncbi:Protein phosphatase 2C [Entamoeba marina]